MNTFAKLQAISDNADTRTGLELVEIETHLAHNSDELRRILENMDPDVGLVIITDRLAAKSADFLDEYRAKNLQPLIAVIPDPENYI